MSAWTKLPPLKGAANPCAHCPPIAPRLDMDRRIAVGFGDASLLIDGLTVWSESGCDWDECMTVREAEKRAAQDPDHDWRIVLNGPLHGETYQRQGKAWWVLVEKNEGFA